MITKRDGNNIPKTYAADDTSEGNFQEIGNKCQTALVRATKFPKTQQCGRASNCSQCWRHFLPIPAHLYGGKGGGHIGLNACT